MLIADHGVAFSRDMRPPLLSSAHPVFLVKPIGKRGTLQTSDAGIYLTDVPKTVCALTGDCDTPAGVSVFDNNDRRNDRAITFYEYKWRNAYWSLKHLPISARYVVAGPVDNVLSWYKRVRPQAVNTLHLTFDGKDDPDVFGLGWTEVKKGEYRSVLGRYAQIYLPLKPGKDATLEMRVRTHKSNQNQYLTFFFNNNEAGGKEISPGEENRLTFQVPGRFITTPVTRITFQFSETHEPEKRVHKNKEALEAVAATFSEFSVRY